MNNTTIKYIAVGALSLAATGVGIYSSSQTDSETNTSLSADIIMEENSGMPVVESDTLTQEETQIAQTLDISSVKKEAHSDEILDITEHKAMETREIFGVVRTDLSFRIKGDRAIGSLTFDRVYGQAFLKDSGELNSEEMESYIQQNISFIGSENSCEVVAKYIPHEENEERLSMITDTYAFTVEAHCSGLIESASIENSLFKDERTSFAHLVSIYTRKRTSVQTLKGILLTPQNPTLEWNTDKEIENIDTDSDGLLDGEEELYKTDKNIHDTDGDGDSDYKEVERGTDPLVPHTY